MFSAKLGQAAEVTQGRLVAGSAEADLRGVATDSRRVSGGELFVALRGERFDGHDFVEAAREAGAVAAVVERELPSPIPQIVVRDSLRALGMLGKWWREQRRPLVVAVTGSAGKTTSKGMTAAILAQLGLTLSNRGSENNEVGLPGTLLRLGDERYCVLEMGSRALGDLDYLADLAQPKIGVVTNIGEAHLGILGGRDKIAQAKSELVAALPPDGTAVLNREDYFFGVMAEMAPCRVLSFGLREGDFRAEDLRTSVEGSSFVLVGPGGRRPVTLRLAGRHNVQNALAAAAAAWAAGARGPQIAQGLADFAGEAMRTQMIRRADGALIVNDAYNASPTSVRAALELLADLGGRKVFIFGDMLELGEYAEEAHRQVGHDASQAGVEVMVAVGLLGQIAGRQAQQEGVTVLCVEDAAEARQAAEEVVRAGDVVLVKASRAMGLETVADRLSQGGNSDG